MTLPATWIKEMRAAGLTGEEVNRAYHYHKMDCNVEACILLVLMERTLIKKEEPKVS